MDKLTHELKRCYPSLQEVITESEYMNRTARDVLYNVKAALDQFQERIKSQIEYLEHTPARAIANSLMSHSGSSSPVPRSEYSSKEPDSNSSENSDTRTVTMSNPNLEFTRLSIEELNMGDTIFPRNSSTDLLSLGQDLTHSKGHVPSTESSELSDFCSELTPTTQKQTNGGANACSLGFMYSVQATKTPSSSECDQSDCNQAILGSKAKHKRTIESSTKHCDPPQKQPVRGKLPEKCSSSKSDELDEYKKKHREITKRYRKH